VLSLPSSPRVRRIVLAYTVNRLGTWFGYVALSIAVYDQTHSAVAVAALLVAGQVLSAFLVPAVVARVEASSLRAGISRLYLFETAATVALAVLLRGRFSLPAVLVLVALDGTAALAASALLRAAAARAAREWAQDAGAGETQQDTGPEAERAANAALNIGFAVTFTLGPALGGIVVPTLGVPTALLIDAGSFLACAAMLLDLKPRLEDAETSSVSTRLRAAAQYIKEVPALRRLLLAQGVALSFFTFSGPVEVAYAKTSLHAGDTGYGLLVGVWGLGVTIGSILFARSIERSLRTLLSMATLAVGLAYLGWAAAPSLALACAIGLVGGVGNGVQWASLISAVQTLTPQRLHGRLMGAVESLGAICPVIGFSLGGAIALLSSPRSAFLVAGAGATVSTAGFVQLRLDGMTSRTVRRGAEEIDLQADHRPRAAALSDPRPDDQIALDQTAVGREIAHDLTNAQPRSSGRSTP
jgi:MFS family permease